MIVSMLCSSHTMSLNCMYLSLAVLLKWRQNILMSDRRFSSWKRNYKVITALVINLCTRLLQYWLYTCVQGYYDIGYIPVYKVITILVIYLCTRLLRYWLYTCVQGYYDIGYIPVYKVITILVIYLCTRLLRYCLYTCVQGY